MASTEAISKYQVLDDAGLTTMLASLFGVIEQNYVRRSTYETKIAELTERLDANDTLENYPVEIDTTGSNGELVLEIPDDQDVTLTVEEGNLILTQQDSENPTAAEAALQKYSFNINEAGFLILTV